MSMEWVSGEVAASTKHCMVSNLRVQEKEEKQWNGREASNDQEVNLKLLTSNITQNRVHFPNSAEKRPSQLHTRLMHFN